MTDAAWASEAGRSRNYLVHALIAAARESVRSPHHALIDEAEHLLLASVASWVPKDSAQSRQSHRGFCLHLDAEVKRLRGTPFVPDEPVWRGL